VGIVLICGIGYNLNFGEAGKKLNTHFFEKVIQRELEKTPDNPLLYTTLGDLYFSNKNYTETIKAYEQSIQLDPDNPYALNNLAWLYATCEVDTFRDPKKALVLAKKAAELKGAPHIFDTLAESYYVNGQFEMAVLAATRALEMTPKNRAYYQSQLKKFKAAMKRSKAF